MSLEASPNMDFFEYKYVVSKLISNLNARPILQSSEILGK